MNLVSISNRDTRLLGLSFGSSRETSGTLNVRVHVPICESQLLVLVVEVVFWGGPIVIDYVVTMASLVYTVTYSHQEQHGFLFIK